MESGFNTHITKALPSRKTGDSIQVVITNNLIRLLSEQLYQSPNKAIEELVVNSYDADAAECRIFVADESSNDQVVAVYDNGAGMNLEGLEALWWIGASNKRLEETANLRHRTQIGKFGIGKLATYALAEHITFISRVNDNILGVSLDYRDFESTSSTSPTPVELAVYEIDLDNVKSHKPLTDVAKSLGIDFEKLISDKEGSEQSWTLVLLENLKSGASNLQMGRLRWILRTAMPLSTEFKLFLNGEQLESSKSDLVRVSTFTTTDFEDDVVAKLAESTGEVWTVENGKLKSPLFPSGIRVEAFATKQSLANTKSDDIGRSHGFFVYVRDRLINVDDGLFGLPPLSFSAWARFRADIYADDLDEDITAPREGLGSSTRHDALLEVLRTVFNEIRIRYETYLSEEDETAQQPKEPDHNYVMPRYVEYPLADVLTFDPSPSVGADADDRWFYLDVKPDANTEELVKKFYQRRDGKYLYRYESRGQHSRFVRFDPDEGVFWLNSSHDLVSEYIRTGYGETLLFDVATSEVMLEVYLREAGINTGVIGEILEKKDQLWRSLVLDHPFSVGNLARMLRESSADDRQLEFNLVASARALGFVAKHIGGPNTPDGIARLMKHPGGETKITLEAKSSKDTPPLAQLDFAGLKQHMDDYDAQGCLLIAPNYSGHTLKAQSATAKRAITQGVSCWTITDLARVVEAAESRHINAKSILKIVTSTFTPEDVSSEVDALLSEPRWEKSALYKAIITALRDLEKKMPTMVRDVSLIAGRIAFLDEFETIDSNEIISALHELAYASQGILEFDGDRITVLGDFDELERRLNGLLKERQKPRRKADTFGS